MGLLGGIGKGISKGIGKGISKGVSKGVGKGVSKGISQGVSKGLGQGLKGVSGGLGSIFDSGLGLAQGITDTVLGSIPAGGEEAAPEEGSTQAQETKTDGKGESKNSLVKTLVTLLESIIKKSDSKKKG